MSNLAAIEDSALKKVRGREVTVKELVVELEGEGHPRDAGVEALIELQKARRLSVREAKPYATLASYVSSPLSAWFWASIVAVGVSVSLVSVSSGVVLYARYAFGSALVLFLPGYALIEALYPKRELDELTRFALSIGLSLALVPLAGLVLNYTPFGIRLLPVTITIASLTVAFLAYAIFRKHQYYKLSKGVI